MYDAPKKLDNILNICASFYDKMKREKYKDIDPYGEENWEEEIPNPKIKQTNQILRNAGGLGRRAGRPVPGIGGGQRPGGGYNINPLPEDLEDRIQRELQERERAGAQRQAAANARAEAQIRRREEEQQIYQKKREAREEARRREEEARLRDEDERLGSTEQEEQEGDQDDSVLKKMRSWIRKHNIVNPEGDWEQEESE
jgi:hypothetical protein